MRAPTAKLGQTITVPVTFHPPSGWQLDPDFPLIAKLFPPLGVSAEKVLFRNADAALTAREGRIDVLLAPHEAGKQLIRAVLAFGVYDPSYRDVKIVQVSIEMDVE